MALPIHAARSGTVYSGSHSAAEFQRTPSTSPCNVERIAHCNVRRQGAPVLEDVMEIALHSRTGQGPRG